MPLTISTPPVFTDMPDAVLSSNQPLKASKLLKLSHNAKYGAVRSETIYMGFYLNGAVVPLPTSPVDGYAYSREEVQYISRLYSNVGPSGAFTNGQTARPSIGTPAASGFALYYIANDVDDSTGDVGLLTSFYKQGGAEVPGSTGIVKVWAICQRADVTTQGGPPQQNVPFTLTPPLTQILTADLQGDLILSIAIPGGIDYRFGGLYLLADLEKQRVSTTLAANVAAIASWGSTTLYATNALIVDPFGHVQNATTGGTSGSTQPVFGESGGTVADGSVIWTDQGFTSTMQVASSTGFLVGDFVDFGDEVVQIEGPGAVGTTPSSTTWTVARAQALTLGTGGSTGQLVCRLTALPGLTFSLPPGYSLDHPSTFGNPATYYQIKFQPGRMRIAYAVLELYNNDSGTGQIDIGLDSFSYEPLMPNMLPGLRVGDGSYAQIEVFGDLAAGTAVASPLQMQYAGTIGVIYALVDQAPTGGPIIGQLRIQAPQIGDGVSFYDLGDPFTIPAGSLSTQRVWGAGHFYFAGSMIIDPAGHIQLCTVTGTSGGSIPTFNDVGGTTTDGSVTWLDDGLLSSRPDQTPWWFFFSGAQLGNIANATILLDLTAVGSTTPGTHLRVYITH